MLVVHIISSGAWIGIDVVVAVLVYTALFTGSAGRAALSYQALGLFAVWPMLAAGLVALATGVTLGLGTNYGLVRYWWVAVKLAIAVVFIVLVPLGLRPLVIEAAQYGQYLAAGGSVTHRITGFLYPVTVSPAGLLTSVLLAVYKPWGRIRKGGRVLRSWQVAYSGRSSRTTAESSLAVGRYGPVADDRRRAGPASSLSNTDPRDSEVIP